jgi:2-desacetyl-2-hydroxyethyl bacteriochlorophyllide A dehydrogenase
MKALVKAKPEPGMELRDLEKPEAGPRELLVRVRSTAICGSDVHIYDWDPAYRFMKLPLIIGHEFAGEIVEVGEGLSGFEPGDRVAINPCVPCWKCRMCRSGRIGICYNWKLLGIHADGSFAEYVAIPEGIGGIYELPEGVSFDEGALLEPFCCALHAWERSGAGPGDRALVVGPGPIGLLTVAALKAAGLSKVFVTGVSADAARLECAEAMGADHAMNVDEEDPARAIEEDGGEGVDFLFEASGSPKALEEALGLLRKGGKAILLGIHPTPVSLPVNEVVRGERELIGSYTYNDGTWRRALELVSRGRVDLEGLITHRLPLEEGLEGLRLAKEKRAVKVVFHP